MKPFTIVLLAAVAFGRGSASTKLFNSTAQLPSNMTEVCKEALTSDIICFPYLISAAQAANRLVHNTTILDSYCNETCSSSLKDWSSNVHDCCGSERYDFGHAAVLGGQPFLQSASDMADSLLWASKTSCLKDEASGELCAPKLTNGTMEECADCTLKYLAARMSSWHGLGKAPSSKGWFALLEKCGVDKNKYPVGNWTRPDLPVPTGTRSITCYGECYHTVKEEDTCESIADGYGLAYDRLVYQNGLDWGCNGLVVGSKICVGSPCSLYTIQENDTCASIVSEKNFTITELLAWNPSIHRSCDNLAWLKGRAICITPPGTDTYDVNVTVSWWGQHWATPTWGEWTPVETVGAAWAPANASALGRRNAPRPTATMIYNATAEMELEKMRRELLGEIEDFAGKL